MLFYNKLEPFHLYPKQEWVDSYQAWVQSTQCIYHHVYCKSQCFCSSNNVGKPVIPYPHDVYDIIFETLRNMMTEWEKIPFHKLWSIESSHIFNEEIYEAHYLIHKMNNIYKENMPKGFNLDFNSDNAFNMIYFYSIYKNRMNESVAMHPTKNRKSLFYLFLLLPEFFTSQGKFVSKDVSQVTLNMVRDELEYIKHYPHVFGCQFILDLKTFELFLWRYRFSQYDNKKNIEDSFIEKGKAALQEIYNKVGEESIQAYKRITESKSHGDHSDEKTSQIVANTSTMDLERHKKTIDSLFVEDVPKHIVFHYVEPPLDSQDKAMLKRYLDLQSSPIDLLGEINAQKFEDDMMRRAPWLRDAIMNLSRKLNKFTFQKQQVIKGLNILLVGPPGTSKTWFAHQCAQLLKLPSMTISAGGSHDNLVLHGVSRGWSSARPSCVLEFISQKSCANPLFVVDELDKVAIGGHNGSIWDTLLQFLDPENSKNWSDPFLMGSCDVSMVNWIATANSIEQIPAPLLDRFNVIYVNMPTEKDRPILMRSVIESLANEYPMVCDLTTEERSVLLAHSHTPRSALRACQRILEIKMHEIKQKNRLH